MRESFIGFLRLGFKNLFISILGNFDVELEFESLVDIGEEENCRVIVFLVY